MVAVHEVEEPETRIPLREALRVSKMSRKALVGWMRRGAIRGYVVGARILVVRESLDQFLKGTPIGVKS